MKALVYRGPGQVSLEERARPVPGAGEVLLEVEACGVCGTDRHIFRGEAPAAAGVILGHEFGGRVRGMGPGVAGIRPGQRVAVNPNLNCGTCRPCREGRPHLCRRLAAYGVDRDGGFAPWAVVAAPQVYPVGEDLPAGAVALVEPLSCALHGLELAGVRPGDSVLLLGAGPMGLLLLLLARRRGAARIVVADPREERRRLALERGADAVADPEAEPPGEFDVALEASGSPAALGAALRAVAPGGTVLVFGVGPRGASWAVEPYDLYRREIRLQGAFTNPFTTARAVRLLQQLGSPLTDFLAHPLPAAELPEFLREPPSGVLKAVVYWRTAG
ncbi:MAG: alcohol dehydrogenase catalytic domain-containing protein [Thermaerobacter sp.]|nr:alcohol dehydrogenase catalytic domain-containing protein [Thermaerobacter sp.]